MGVQATGCGVAAGRTQAAAASGEAVRPQTRTVLIADQALIRGGLRSILDQEADISVVGEAGDGRQAIAVCRSLRPDVVLMDVKMPVLDGISAARAARRPSEALRVVILTTFDLDEYMRPALLAPSVTRRLIDTYVERPAADPERARVLSSLTTFEDDVQRAVADGLSNPEIAVRLHLGEGTVKTHVTRVLTKLGILTGSTRSSSPTAPAWSAADPPGDKRQVAWAG